VDTGDGFGARASLAYWPAAGLLVLLLAFVLLRRRSAVARTR
jgi:hypothetical protein